MMNCACGRTPFCHGRRPGIPLLCGGRVHEEVIEMTFVRLLRARQRAAVCAPTGRDLSRLLSGLQEPSKCGRSSCRKVSALQKRAGTGRLSRRGYHRVKVVASGAPCFLQLPIDAQPVADLPVPRDPGPAAERADGRARHRRRLSRRRSRALSGGRGHPWPGMQSACRSAPCRVRATTARPAGSKRGKRSAKGCLDRAFGETYRGRIGMARRWRGRAYRWTRLRPA